MTSRRLIRIKVLQLLYSYIKQDGVAIADMERTLLKSMEKSKDLYYLTFQLLSDVRHKFFLRQDAAKNRHFVTESDINPNTRFIDNPIFGIFENKTFQTYVKTNTITWVDAPEVVDDVCRKIENFDSYILYMGKGKVTFEEHKQMFLDIFVEIIAKNEAYFQALEDKSILWNDDYELVLAIVYKTIKNMKEVMTEDDTVFYPIFSSSEEYDYARTLLRKSIMEYSENIELIEKFTQNWDVDRISDIDRLIMTMAITELKNFPSIPVKVTLDEYIEISKSYSSQNSSSFINGILDHIVALLKESDSIKKVGRGLME